MTARPRFQLTPEQHHLLLQPLHRSRVGKNPKGFSHLEAWDVRRWLIRVFGFGGYDIETTSLDVVKELEIPPGTIKYRNGGTNDKTIWTVVYRAQVRLTVYDQYGGHAVFEDGACGDSTNQPAVGDCHDNASKTALSQALKRCAVNLGDQFGLGLYNDGSTDAVVVRTAVGPEQSAAGVPALAVEDAPVRPEPGTEPVVVDEHQEQTQQARPVSGPPASDRPVSGPPQQQAPSGAVPAPAALSAAATGLLSDLADAIDETALRRVWKLAGEAASEKRLTLAESDYIRDQWAVRKEHLFPSKPATPAQHKRIHALCREAFIEDREVRLHLLSEVTGRFIDTQNRLSVDEAKAVIERLVSAAAQSNPAEQEGQAA